MMMCLTALNVQKATTVAVVVMQNLTVHVKLDGTVLEVKMIPDPLDSTVHLVIIVQLEVLLLSVVILAIIRMNWGSQIAKSVHKATSVTMFKILLHCMETLIVLQGIIVLKEQLWPMNTHVQLVHSTT